MPPVSDSGKVPADEDMYEYTGKEETHNLYPEFNSEHEGMIRPS